ncbi:hypothetical protein HOD65_04395 [bacterium]|nr:hypothetical protein [bacterium]MBT4763573.1 hypothetical protein [bacterium]MBT5400945.1 hypothetical protein [bacterium]
MESKIISICSRDKFKTRFFSQCSLHGETAKSVGIEKGDNLPVVIDNRIYGKVTFPDELPSFCLLTCQGFNSCKMFRENVIENGELIKKTYFTFSIISLALDNTRFDPDYYHEETHSGFDFIHPIATHETWVTRNKKVGPDELHPEVIEAYKRLMNSEKEFWFIDRDAFNKLWKHHIEFALKLQSAVLDGDSFYLIVREQYSKVDIIVSDKKDESEALKEVLLGGAEMMTQ